MSLQSSLKAVMECQPHYTRTGPDPWMERRRGLLHDAIPDLLEDHGGALAAALAVPPEDLLIEGSNGRGGRAFVPWVRAADRQISGNARQGWYAVYLWERRGEAVYLSVNQGTQILRSGGMRTRPDTEIESRSNWARSRLATRPGLLTDEMTERVELGPGTKGDAYSIGNVVAFRYPREAIPDDTRLIADLIHACNCVTAIVRDEATDPSPVEPSPEVTDVSELVERITGQRSIRRRPRISAAQRRAIELRAMAVAKAHWRKQGWEVKDVSADHSYDLHAKRGTEELHIEVKGTTGPGTKVVLTRNEVRLHRAQYPNNALALVSGISLSGTPDKPSAKGGTLEVAVGWLIDESDLDAIAYEYRLDGLFGDPSSTSG